MTRVSAKEVTLGIDIGSTAVKAVAADEDGRVVARTRIPHQLRVPEPDYLEHDADQAWRQGPLAAWRELATPNAAAVAVSAMVPSMTAVDARGRPMTPGLLYGDSRGRTAEAAGGFLSGEAAEFLRWTARAAPDAAGYWPAPAVANYALGAQGVIDFATAGVTFPLFDGTGWNADACAACGASIDRMPEVATMGAAVGRVSGSDTVLAAGAIDALCEQLVAGVDGDGDVLVLCGTTLIVWALIPEPKQVPGLWTIPHIAKTADADARSKTAGARSKTAGADGKSLIGGASNAGGLFLNWLDGIVAQADSRSANPRRVPVWSPYVRGERSPFHDPDRRAVLDGLDLTHDAASVRRAAYEASGFVVRHMIELSGVPVSRVVVAGGGTRVAAWMQAIADATGRPVEVSAVAEGAALGAAFLARMAVGLESSMSDAARWAATDRVVEPDPEWTAATQDRYRRFLELANPTPR